MRTFVLSIFNLDSWILISNVDTLKFEDQFFIGTLLLSIFNLKRWILISNVGTLKFEDQFFITPF